MRTTLTIDDDVVIRLEKLREMRRAPFKVVLNDVLRHGLDALEQPAAARPRYRIEPHDAGRCYLPNLDSIHDALVFGEGEGYR